MNKLLRIVITILGVGTLSLIILMLGYLLWYRIKKAYSSFKYPETAYIEELEQTIQEQGIKLEHQQRRLREYEIQVDRLTSSREMSKIKWRGVK